MYLSMKEALEQSTHVGRALGAGRLRPSDFRAVTVSGVASAVLAYLSVRVQPLFQHFSVVGVAHVHGIRELALDLRHRPETHDCKQNNKK